LLAVQSRQASLIGRREVLSGKAKFGIFGDGKEMAQIALAKAFRKGDFRSGYYRDQTWMFALGINTIQQFFAQLYAHADVRQEPNSAGRQMNAHFATREAWTKTAVSSTSPTNSTPPPTSRPPVPKCRAWWAWVTPPASTANWRNCTSSPNSPATGDEIAWGRSATPAPPKACSGKRSTPSACCKAPVIISIWDDGYGISVPNEFQMVKGNLSNCSRASSATPNGRQGYDIYTVKGWDYPALIETYQKAAEIARRDHVPAIVHVTEMTQPQGHSTSGSHERYKSAGAAGL
jgi:2-oxoisovalerate dehydrogenase E1 component